MSELRKQLDAAEREYTATRYPGDLVADVNRRQTQRMQRTIGRLVVGASIGAAVAACVTIVVYVRSTISTGASDNTVAVVTPTDDADLDEGILSFGKVPNWSEIEPLESTAPSFSSLVPPAWSIVPTADTLGSVPMSDDNPGSTTQTKESV